MNIILQDVKTSHNDTQRVPDSPLRLLQALDLLEWEAQYHWASFEQKTIAAQCHLDKHDECQARIKALKAELNMTLCPAEVVR